MMGADFAYRNLCILRYSRRLGTYSHNLERQGGFKEWPLVSCFSKIQIGFTFLVPADPGSPKVGR